LTITLDSFRGTAINDGVAFTSHFLVPDLPFSRAGDARLVPVETRWPRIARVQRSEVSVPVHIQIRSGDPIVQQDVLHGIFAVGLTGALVATVDGVSRTLTGTVIRTIPQDGSAIAFTAVLMLPDPRWRSTLAKTVTHLDTDLLFSGDVVDDTVRALGVEGDGLTDDNSVGLWKERKNLWFAGSAETASGESMAGAYVIGFLANAWEGAQSPVLFGSQSVQWTYQNSTIMALMGIDFGASAISRKIAQAWVWLPSGWNGGDIAFNISRFTSAVVISQETASSAVTDTWQRVWLTFDVATDTIGQVTLVATSAPSAGQVAYFDGVTICESPWPRPFVATLGTAPVVRSQGQCDMPAALSDETKAWIAVRLRAGFDSSTGPLPVDVDQYAFDWRDDGGDRLRCWYDFSVSAWQLQRVASGVGTIVSVADAVSIGDKKTVIAHWTEGSVLLSIDGAPFVSAADTNIPTLSADLIQIGRDGLDSNAIDSDLMWLLAGVGGSLSDANAADMGAADDDLTSLGLQPTEVLRWDGTQQSPISSTWDVTGSGNASDDRAIITLTPRTQKAANDAQQHVREVIVANRAEGALDNWPVLITEVAGGLEAWAHADEVAQGDSLASGDDVRVLVDGVEVPRYDQAGGFGAPSLRLWANLSMGPRRTAELASAITAASPADGETLEVGPDEAVGWPSSGALVIESSGEVITYASRTRSSFAGIKRGQRNTAASSANASDTIWFVERRVQIVYGWLGADTPDPQTERSPMLDRAFSSNETHRWNAVASTDDPRSAQWIRAFRETNSQSREIGIPGSGTLTELEWQATTRGPQGDVLAANLWRYRFPMGLIADGLTPPLAVTPSADDTMGIITRAVADNGVREIISEQFSDGGAAGIFGTTTRYLEVEFEGRSAVVASTPLAIGIADSDNIALGSSLSQIVIIPEPNELGAGVTRVDVGLSVGGTGSASITMTLGVIDDEGSFFQVAQGGNETVSANPSSIQWVRFEVVLAPTQRLELARGTALAIQVEFTSIVSGSPTVDWVKSNFEYAGSFTSRYTRIIDLLYDFDANSRPDFDAVASAATPTAELDRAARPYVDFRGEQDVYQLNGVLTNETTGDTITLDAFVQIDDTIELDMGARTVRNLTTGENLLATTTIGDAERWIIIDPGLNTLSYVEPGIVHVDSATTFDDVWE